ncbi:hypothetical protein OAT10_00350 [Luminiphilus sp.]|nr:hypothetical protein [Luminiphilus sp.]
MKHNKKRNIAFVYEALIREATKAVINKESSQKTKVFSILKEFFSKDKILAKELRTYKAIYETDSVDKKIADKIIQEAKIEYLSLDKEKVFQEQTRLIETINTELSPKIYNNFIPNYKDLATIHQIFNSSTSIKSRVILEESIAKNISMRAGSLKPMKTVDNLTMKTFLNKYNKKYGDLLEEQKSLLNLFITSFDDKGTSLKLYLNDEISRLRSELLESKNIKNIFEDKMAMEKIGLVLETLDSYSKREIDRSMLQQVLKIQNLVGDLK